MEAGKCKGVRVWCDYGEGGNGNVGVGLCVVLCCQLTVCHLFSIHKDVFQDLFLVII